ncbi:M48 family metalloprotease [Kibdelosporangium lantanae]|uniref:M48 family metalloprotease n=1 Tax=Kibdelosporangium lantanae TaxID=1497396 RepID=A0ABW3M5P2_9PSEU
MTESDVQQSAPRVRFPGISPRAYEHPADKGAMATLRAVPGVGDVLKIANGLWNERAERLYAVASYVRVSETQFPVINRMHKESAEILDLRNVPKLYVARSPEANAYTIGIDEPFIVLTSTLVESLDNEALRFVIGHEQGHVLSGHAVLLTLLQRLLNLQASVQWVPIGALGPDAQPGRYPHSCTAAVVHSPHHNVIMTAAHCLHPNMKFYPHFNHGKPDSAYGTYTVKAVIIPTEYVNYEESHQDKNNPYDFAFAVVQPEPNKKNVEDRTGALYPVVNPTAPNTPTSIGGYNQNSPNMSSCRGTARLVEWSQYRYVRVDCNGMNGGTSGSPFVVDNTRNVIGLMGGFDRGGDSTPGRNYSAHFSTIFAKYYAQAQNHS